tara:strand:- start:285 stop:626 length:342 start_codon:yes stop_codon:yes gene_type:complete
LVPLNKLVLFLFLAFSVQAEDIFFDCQNMNNNEDKQKLVIKYKNKQFLFKENIYLFNSYAESEIFAQRRSILLNSFLEFNEKSNMLTEVNSWLYKVTKDDYICKKRDSSKGYK